MKAIVCEAYGSPDVLQIKEVETPIPGNHQVRIKIHATTVTSGDCRMRSFTVPPMFWIPGRLALGITKPRLSILGTEIGGEIDAVGKDVTRFKVGDPVVAFVGHTTGDSFGANAEYRCMAEDGMIVPKPANITYEEAAAIPFGGGTALNFLKAGKLKPGQKILINGASGAVGVYAVQLARYFGAEVTGVCSTKNVELVQSLGAHHVIDYTQEDFTQSGLTYDIIFDAVGNTTFAKIKPLIKPDGYYLHAVMVLAEVKASWYKMTSGIHVVGGTPHMPDNWLAFLIQLVEAGEIKPIVDRCYPMEQIAEAHRYVETGHKRGAVVINITSPI